MRAVLVVVLAACAATPAAREPAPSAGDEPAIRDIFARLQAANNAGDVDGWVGLFGDGAVYMASGMPAVTTRNELRDVARAGFANKADVRIQPLEIVIAGEWAFARNAVTGTVVLTSGETIAIDSKELAILQRGPERAWKIARLMINSNR